MKVFLDGNIFSMRRWGGIQRTFQELLPRFPEIESTVKITLYLRRKLNGAWWPTSPEITCLYEQSIYPWRWLFGKYRVQDYLLDRAHRRNKPDIFHATYFTRPSAIRTPYVLSVYDMFDEIYTPLQENPKRWKNVERKRQCILAADLILTNSHYTARDLLNYYSVDEKKVVPISLGVHQKFSPIQDEYRKKTFLANHGLTRPFFLYVGARRYNKNFMGLFRAYARFKFAEDIDLVAVGEDDPFTREELMFMTSLAPKGVIRHLKFVSEDELVLAYNTAVGLIFPSLSEGFGLPVLEAMACGTPVLTSNTTSLPEVAGDAALFFNPRDHQDICAAMESVLNPHTAQDLVEKGKARAKLFTWEETAQKTLEAYRQLV